MKTKNAPFLLFLLFVAQLTFAQYGNKLHFDYLGIAEGLSNGTVYSITQDSKGFLWFATDGGVSKYDGKRVKTYTQLADFRSPRSLSNPNSTQVFCDSKDHIWIATLNGINRLDQETDTIVSAQNVFDTKHKKIHPHINKIYEDSKGDIWFVTKFNLYRVKKKDKYAKKLTFDTFGFKTKNGARHVKSITSLWEHNGKLLVGSYEGLLVLNKKQTGLIKHPTIKQRSVTHLSTQRDSMLWIVIANRRIFKTNGQKLKQITFSDSILTAVPDLKNWRITDIETDEKNKMWVSTNNRGLFVLQFSDDSFSTVTSVKQYTKNYDKQNTLNSNRLIDIFKDASGVLWISSAGQGLNIYDPHKIKFETHVYNPKQHNSIGSQAVAFIFVDSYDYIWVAAKNSYVTAINPKTNEHFHFKGILLNSVSWITEIKPGLIAFAGHNNQKKALTLMQLPDEYPEKLEPQKAKLSFPLQNKPAYTRGSVKPIFLDSQGNLWWNSWHKGTFRLNLETGKLKTLKKNGISSLFHFVSGFAEDKQGNIWMSSRGFGLIRYAQKDSSIRAFQLSTKNTVSSNNLFCVYVNKKQQVVMGYNNAGFSIFDPQANTWQHYKKGQGINTNFIKAITEDDKNNLWLTSDKGLFRFDQKQKTFLNFTPQDGLQGYDFTVGAIGKFKDGTMILGGRSGYSLFHPDKIQNEYKQNIPVEITGFKINGNEVPIGNDKQAILNRVIEATQHIEVNYLDKILRFELAALSYASYKKNRFRYKLSPYDNQWNYTSINDPYIIYTGLPGGKYSLSVQASSNGKDWTENPRVLTIKVTPPYWETLWFKAGIAIIVFLIVFGVMKLRYKRIKQQKLILEQKVKERTQELNDTLNRVTEQNHEIEQRNEEILSQNEEIMQQAEELKAVNDDVNKKSALLEQANKVLEKQKSAITSSYENIKHLGEFGQNITASLNIEDISQLTQKYIAQFIAADAFGVGFLVERKNELFFPQNYINGAESEAFFTKIDPDNDLASLCLSRKNLIKVGTSDELASNYTKNLPAVDGKVPESALYAPLIEKGKQLGVLFLLDSNQNKFGEQQYDLLRNLASYLSIAIANAKAYQLIQQKNQDIKSSISYAQTIQQAILPLDEKIDAYFDHFTIFRPKDIVSGDFYLFTTIEGPQQAALKIFAVIDCTGHGVPGAIMSIVSNGALTRIVKERRITEPAKILEELDITIRTTLKQDTTGNHDGMDVCLCSFQEMDGKTIVRFSASKRPLIIYRNKEQKVESFKGNRRYIGGIDAKNPEDFSTQEFLLEKNDIVYLTTDGYVDQHGPDRKKIGTRAFLQLLGRIGGKSMTEQRQVLESAFDQHKQNEEQRDDVTVVGIRLK